MEWIVLLLLGAVVGLLAGLFGIGGGLILVPALTFLLPKFDITTSEQALPIAIATALATVVVTGLSAAITQIKQKKVDWHSVHSLTPGLIIGGVTGALLTSMLPVTLLGISFGVLEILIAAYMFYGKQPQQHVRKPSAIASGLFGWFSGTLSSVIGIGGGTINTPWLVWHHHQLASAIATSSVLGVVIALSGTLTHLTGHLIQWPIAIALVSTSLLTAPVGAMLTHKLPTKSLKRNFALLLIMLGIMMLIKFNPF